MFERNYRDADEKPYESGPKVVEEMGGAHVYAGSPVITVKPQTSEKRLGNGETLRDRLFEPR